MPAPIAGKQREFAALLAPLGLELLLQGALGIDSVAETGSTFEANALLKARHAAGRQRLPALADDSGLEVDALGGRPGVYSARYAGEAASDADNNAQLLARAGWRAAAERAARAIAACWRWCATPRIRTADCWRAAAGRADRARPRGQRGFGYDPLFLPEGLERSGAPSCRQDCKNRAQPPRQGAAGAGAATRAQPGDAQP